MAGSGGRGAEHHRKGRVTLQHSTERGEINSDKLQIFTNYYRRKRRGKGWWWWWGGHIGANLLTRVLQNIPGLSSLLEEGSTFLARTVAAQAHY